MKTIVTAILLVIIFTSFRCSKQEPEGRSNCIGLVTDTTGTGDNGRIYMPTAFTPNGDGINDVIFPYTQNIASIRVTIYNEDDAEVFTSITPGQGFSSTVPTSTYERFFYRIQAVTNAGHQIGTCGELYKIACRPPGIVLYFGDQLTASGFTGTTSETAPTCP